MRSKFVRCLLSLPLLVLAAGLCSCGKEDKTSDKVVLKMEITLNEYTDQHGEFFSPVWKADDIVALRNTGTGETAQAGPSIPGSRTATFLFKMSRPALGTIMHADFPADNPEYSGQTALTSRSESAGDRIELISRNASKIEEIVDDTYPMVVCDAYRLSEGAEYKKYRFTKVPNAYVHVVTVDATRKDLTIMASIADEMMPNPCNETTNNGKRLRETISENVSRKIRDGRKILAAINGDYYATVPGVLLSCHVENGEAVFINNPEERRREPYFLYGLTVYEDGTLSTEARTVSCSARYAGQEITVYSVNDTIVKLTPGVPSRIRTYQTANAYTKRFVRQPFPSKPELVNDIGTDALFIVASVEGGLKVNTGYQKSRVKAVYDGRTSALSTAPYVTADDEWVLQLTGASADKFAAAKVGDEIEFKTEIAIGGEVKPIKTHVGGKYRFITHGQPSTGMEDSRSATRHTMVDVSEDGKTVRFITIENTLMFHDAGVIAMLLGGYNVVKLDGGGSSCMWINRGGGELVHKSTDSRGPERSNMNYLQLCAL